MVQTTPVHFRSDVTGAATEIHTSHHFLGFGPLLRGENTAIVSSIKGIHERTKRAYGNITTNSVPLTDRGCLQGCEKSRLPHFLDSRLIDGGMLSALPNGPSLLPEISSVSISVRGRLNLGAGAAGRIR
jgi:hypothetical protein